jgi:hypothetical protein
VRPTLLKPCWSLLDVEDHKFHRQSDFGWRGREVRENRGGVHPDECLKIDHVARRERLSSGVRGGARDRHGGDADGTRHHLATLLSRWQREQQGAATPAPDTLIFPSTSGGPVDPDNLRHRVWAPALAKAKLRHVRIHSLRHTFASMLIAQGENVKYISSRLGHASVQITLDRYGHLFPDEKRGAAARLEAQLRGAAPSSNHPAEQAETPEIDREQQGTPALRSA